VGAALDDPSQGAIAQRLGLRLVRIGVAWPAGASAPDPGLAAAFGGLPAGLGALVELNAGSAPPTDPDSQAALAQYAASLAQQVPAIQQIVLTPSPTVATAAPYAAGLEAVRDAVHAVAPAVAVGPLLDGALAPKSTVPALGRALTATGHAQPWADVVAFRPAPAPATGAWVDPAYPALTSAFRGTLPPVLVDGVASTTPSVYASAVAADACAPQLAGVVLDRLVDSASTDVAPTGLVDANGADKPGTAAVADAAALAQRGATVCPGLATPAAASTVTYPESVTSGVPVSLQLGCTRDCLYLATLRAPDGTPVVAARGSLQGGAAAQTVTLPKTSLARPSYTVEVQVVNAVNPGPITKLSSGPLPRG
jgi:hypothetical protein